MRPLHLAAYVQVEHPGRNEPGITFSALLDYGAHIDAVDDGGLTAEQYFLAAADSTHGDLLHALLGHGTMSFTNVSHFTSNCLIQDRLQSHHTTSAPQIVHFLPRLPSQ